MKKATSSGKNLSGRSTHAEGTHSSRHSQCAKYFLFLFIEGILPIISWIRSVYLTIWQRCYSNINLVKMFICQRLIHPSAGVHLRARTFWQPAAEGHCATLQHAAQEPLSALFIYQEPLLAMTLRSEPLDFPNLMSG